MAQTINFPNNDTSKEIMLELADFIVKENDKLVMKAFETIAKQPFGEARIHQLEIIKAQQKVLESVMNKLKSMV